MDPHTANSQDQRPALRSLRYALISLAAVAILGANLSACGESSPSLKVGSDAIIIDVRTPAEFAGGHLKQALLKDYNAGQLSAELADLDPSATYFIYCRSGNRSAQAVAMMKDAGFTQVTDLGSLEQASSETGIKIVTD
ncbi:MAG TPA: rhodanese-like domain-containing protein [Marmoricola sp.]|nr:rhodanese-like domain-containing protein [Marmoricola sp.]